MPSGTCKQAIGVPLPLHPPRPPEKTEKLKTARDVTPARFPSPGVLYLHAPPGMASGGGWRAVGVGRRGGPGAGALVGEGFPSAIGARHSAVQPCTYKSTSIRSPVDRAPLCEYGVCLLVLPACLGILFIIFGHCSRLPARPRPHPLPSPKRGAGVCGQGSNVTKWVQIGRKHLVGFQIRRMDRRVSCLVRSHPQPRASPATPLPRPRSCPFLRPPGKRGAGGGEGGGAREEGHWRSERNMYGRKSSTI